MKNTLLVLATGAVLAFCNTKAGAQGVAVNTSGAAANSSAILDASSTTQGILIPRMTNAQVSAIASPATGLLVYQTDGTAGFYFYNGSSWVSLNASGGTAGGDLTGSYPNPTIGSSASTGNNVVTAINASGGGLSGTKLATNSVSVNAMSATGTRNSTTYLRGDNTWATVSGGTVTSVSSGNLSPVFTSSVATNTTTPSITYTMSPAPIFSVLTNSTGAISSPVYGKVHPSALLDIAGTPSSTTFYRGDGQWQTPVSSGAYVFVSGTNALGSFTGTHYMAFPCLGNSGSFTSISATGVGTPIPMACTIDAFYFTGTVVVAGGSGSNTITVTVYQNGNPTSITANITLSTALAVGTSVTGSDLTHTLTVSQGDILSLEVQQGNGGGPNVQAVGTAHAH